MVVLSALAGKIHFQEGVKGYSSKPNQIHCLVRDHLLIQIVNQRGYPLGIEFAQRGEGD